MKLALKVNGEPVTAEVEDRTTLADFLRDGLNLTGTHLGCEHGVCGACTVLLDGEPVRACIMLAAAAAGREVRTIEGFDGDKAMETIRECFSEAHGLQCGYCTPGFLMTLVPFLQENPHPSEQEIREAISGNLCRCTGYQNIVEAVKLAAEKIATG